MVQLIEWGLEDRGLGLFPFFVFVFYLFLFYFFFIFLKFRYKMYELNVYYIHELKTNKPKKVHTHIRLGKWYRSAAFFDHHDRQNIYSYTSILREKTRG